MHEINNMQLHSSDGIKSEHGGRVVKGVGLRLLVCRGCWCECCRELGSLLSALFYEAEVPASD
jgi:hypothetical protein